MKNYSKRILSFFLALLLIFSLVPAKEVEAASKKYVKSLTLAKTKVSVTAGSKLKVKATVKVTGKPSKYVTVKSSKTSVATVKVTKPNSKGVSTITITGKKAGKATITVKTKAKNSKKKYITKKITVTVKKKATAKPSAKPSPTPAPKPTPTPSPTPAANPDATGFTENDYKVTKGTKNIYIEFKINKETTTEKELQEEGYTVNGSVASKTTVCETATYTFTKLPGTLEELKKISLDEKFGPMAATIAALSTYKSMSGPDAMYNHPIFEMFDYLVGPGLTISKTEKSGIYYSMKQTLESGGQYCYYDGATPSNGYTPTKPLTFTLIHGPYYIPAKETINGPRPETHMILVEFAGDDSQRYMDVYQSSRDNKWYSYEGQWKHMVAGIKPIVNAL